MKFKIQEIKSNNYNLFKEIGESFVNLSTVGMFKTDLVPFAKKSGISGYAIGKALDQLNTVKFIKVREHGGVYELREIDIDV